MAAAAWLGAGTAAAQEASLQDIAKAAEQLPQIVIYTAKEIVTLDPARPSAQAVAVVGDRILAVGTLDEVKAVAGKQAHSVDTTFAKHVIVPGFVAQHDHPLLAALTMTSEIIAIEDWVLPQGTSKAAKNRAEYLKRVAEASAKTKDPEETMLTWGYHQYFHGELKKADLDAISATRPILVWHRSAHEFYLNSAAEKKYGVTKAWFDKQSESVKKQSDFPNAHYWEQGAFAVLPLVASAIATPARVKAGLEFVESYYHANVVTLGAEPGGLASKNLQDAQNAVMSDSASPFRFYFIVDGRSVTGAFKDDQVVAESEKFLGWGQGMTAYLPKQVKLFADGAIVSQAMQKRTPYTDGHKGEWMMDLEFFGRTMRVYWDAGYQLHIHVNGDAGLDMVLDQLELNMRRRPRSDHRTVIIHFAVSNPDQVERIKRLGALKAVTLDAAYSLQLETQVGSVVPGKLANFTILADNPVTCDPVKIKDIAIWGTVDEGRLLPVKRAAAGQASLGPVFNERALAATADLARHEESAGAGHAHSDACSAARALEAAVSASMTGGR